MRMPVPVVDVRKMRGLVGQDLVAMGMYVRLIALPREIVTMPMMLVMQVSMSVLLDIMGMLVFMSFSHVEPYAHGHQSGSGPKQR